MIYPISDSSWVSPVHCVPKKGGITVVENENNELIPTRLVTGWRVCIDYRKLNEATCKDHFPLPFMDQMLERLAGNEFYYFLDGFSGYFQIPIDPQGQEKTTFTRRYGTFAYRRMPFGLCNAPGTFQRCMMAIFHDMIEKAIAIISDRGTHFCNDKFAKVMSKYGATHRLATAYHPQTSGQVELSNRGLKRILERMVGENQKMKKLHDSMIKNRIFNVGDRVLLFNSRLKIFSGKLKTRWSGPFTITEVFPYGTIELSQPDGPNFKVNGHRVKHYFGGDIPSKVVSDLQTFPMDK
nr:reverse transcriptase domain-containing protein [Tanacetum cinerariifolium]